MKSILFASFNDKQKTVKTLIRESTTSSNFYVFLAISTIVITLGLLIGSSSVVIGGMLLAPLLFPILSIALGVVTSSSLTVMRGLKIIAQSLAIVLFVSAFITFFYAGVDGDNLSLEIIDRVIAPKMVYFIIAFASSIAVTFAWTKEDLSAAVSGVAVAVALLPPLATTGIGLALFKKSVIVGSFTLFSVNFFAILLGAIIVLSLFGFAQLQKETEDTIVESDDEEKIRHEVIAKAKEEEAKELGIENNI